MRVSLILTAAGSSTRFRANSHFGSGLRPTAVSKLQSTKGKSRSHFASELSAQPADSKKSKLFFELGGIPVLERTLLAFQKIDSIHETIVAVQPEFLKKAQSWGLARGFKKIKWVAGGKTRAESVLHALKKTSARNDWVMVHDGARPLIQPATIQKLLSQASRYDGIILAKKVVPTLKKISTTGHHIESTIDRSNLAEAETPQIIKRRVLIEAYQSVSQALTYTDESSLIEAAGGKMGVLLHTDWNPKLTHFTDLELAEAKVNSQAEIRIGNGYDIHRLVSGRKLWVGGVRIPFKKGSLGHSDGDALLHSITDAILGALGLGDIGDWFSDRDRKYKNIASTVLLKKVLAHIRKLSWVVSQVDSNVILEKPKLGPLKPKIRSNLSKLLMLSIDRVSVKAKTYEGLPPFGTEEAWACQSVVVLKKIK